MIGAEKRALSIAIVVAAALAPASASAFCRTSVCSGDTSQVCTPASTGCGTPLFWKSGCVGFWMQKDGSSQISAAAAAPFLEAAFANWTQVECPGGGHPSITVKDAGEAACNKAEYNQDGANANVVMFDDASWPYGDTTNALALTTVTYDLDTGEIYDADMELNSHQATFTTSDTGVEVDLPSIVQHESGHFLGLAHSSDAEATMFAAYAEHSVTLRTLDPDDVAAICAAYPPNRQVDASCSTQPRHGFSSECDAPATASTDSSSSGCNTAGPGIPGAAGIFAAAALALAAVIRRRGSKR